MQKRQRITTIVSDHVTRNHQYSKFNLNLWILSPPPPSRSHTCVNNLILIINTLIVLLTLRCRRFAVHRGQIRYRPFEYGYMIRGSVKRVNKD